MHIISDSFNIIHKVGYLIPQWAILSIGFDERKFINDFSRYFLALFNKIFIYFDWPATTTPQLVPFLILMYYSRLFFPIIFLLICIVFVLTPNPRVIVLVLFKIWLLTLNSVHISWFRVIVLLVFRIELRHLSRSSNRAQFTFALISWNNWSALLLFESFILISRLLICDPWLNYWIRVR